MNDAEVLMRLSRLADQVMNLTDEVRVLQKTVHEQNIHISQIRQHLKQSVPENERTPDWIVRRELARMQGQEMPNNEGT